MKTYSRPIKPEEVMEEVKKINTPPNHVVDFVNECIVNSYNKEDRKGFLKRNEFFTNFSRHFAKNVIEDWWKHIPEAYAEDWVVTHEDIKFEYSEKYTFKSKEKH